MRRPPGLGSKLFASHVLVTLVGTITFLIAVSILAPIIFGGLMAGSMAPSHEMAMGEMMSLVASAFERTLLYSLFAAALAAAVTATFASLFVARRIVHPLRLMRAATRRIAAGRYDERVPAGTGDELGDLAESFNAMAQTLQATEQRRLDLISDVSHELRTPLSTIEGYMEGLIDGVVEPSDETWALVHAEAERLRHLVDDLQHLSRAEAGRLALREERIMSHEAIRQVAGRLAPLFDAKGVTLKTEVRKRPPPVLADPDRLAQVLTNLLSNALRHTPPGGSVTAEAEPRKERVLFRISDTGEGIAEEHLPHVFERFYRADRARSRGDGGAGLGLAISKALVEAMGGEIWAESEGQDRGAAFSFTLPAASPDT
ncbi:MAG TPA: ATP-binding protein [Rubrobacter sp.]|nr:ATP-binding protein [Rubrobacter sp.]